MSQKIEIAGRAIGSEEKPFIIAEIGQAHDGSLGMAHAFIDIGAECGVDAIKFQTHIADAESTLDEPFRVRFSDQDATRFEYWKRMSFTAEQWQGLARHAREAGITFLSSAFSREAVDLLDSIGMSAWKIGSGETVTGDIIDAVAKKGKPVLISTGMSSWDEIDAVVALMNKTATPFALFQCTSRYPASLSDVGLNVLEQMRGRYACPVGLSDHTGSLWPAVAAMAQGANLIEVHLAMHPKAFGPDVTASLMPDDLRRLCEARDAIAIMHAQAIDKDKVAAEMMEMRQLFSKSLALKRPLPAGHVLTEEDITLKKPGTGLARDLLPALIGQRLVRAVGPDRLLTLQDVGFSEVSTAEKSAKAAIKSNPTLI